MNFILLNISAFIATFLKYSINTHLRIAHFLAQMSYETNVFTALVENTNYTTTARLLQVFPSYFNATTAAQYVGKPIAIANRAYANRMGNGNEASGDGYKFRGRGLVHLTGRSNYQAYKNYSGIDVIADPDLAARIDVALDIAGWYWSSRNINVFADADNVTEVTKKINGGTNGLSGRVEKLNYYRTQDLLGLFEKKKK